MAGQDESVEINPPQLLEEIGELIDERIKAAPKNGSLAMRVLALSLAALAAGSGSGLVVSKRAESSQDTRFAALERVDSERGEYVERYIRHEAREEATVEDIAYILGWIDDWEKGGELPVDREQNRRAADLERRADDVSERLAAIEAQARQGGRFTRDHGLRLFDILGRLFDTLLRSGAFTAEERQQIREMRDQLRETRDQLRQIVGMQ